MGSKYSCSPDICGTRRDIPRDFVARSMCVGEHFRFCLSEILEVASIRCNTIFLHNSNLVGRVCEPEAFSCLNCIVDELRLFFSTVLARCPVLSYSVAQMVRSCHPREGPPTQYQWRRLGLRLSPRAYYIYSLGLAATWVWIRRKLNVVVVCELFRSPTFSAPHLCWGQAAEGCLRNLLLL